MVRRYLSYEDLSVRWAIPVETLRKWRSARYKGFDEIGVRMGKHVRFEETEVADWEDRLHASQHAAGGRVA